MIMRLISLLLLASILFSCNSKTSIMKKKEFAKVYLDALRKQYPGVNFELTSDLTITSKKGNLEYKHYIDNIYVAYTSEPDSLNGIMSRFLASTTDLYTVNKEIDINNIIPVIKPNEYLDQINSLNKDSSTFPMITEKYNDQLIIAYAEDSKNSIKYINEESFRSLSISRDSLKAITLRNFSKIIPDIQRQGDNGLYMVTAGGNYEASLILLSSIWTRENFPVDGAFIVAIPNRDLLMVTGSKNRTGINKIKKIVADSYQNGNYQISKDLYKWTGQKFEKYE
jgi:uncharacterized protein YtpQ (UPF0354 family)